MEKKERTLVFEDKKDPRLDSIAFHPNGQSLAIGRYGNVVFVDTSSFKESPISAIGAKRLISSLIFSANGDLLAGVTSNHATLWDVKSANALTTFSFDRALGSTVSHAFSPNGEYLAIGIASLQRNQSLVKIWHINEKREIAEIECKKSFITCVAWSGDGNTIATCGRDQTVRLWDVSRIWTTK